MYLYKPSDKSTSEPVDFWYMSSVSKEENRSPRPGNRRARNDNNQNEPSSGNVVMHLTWFRNHGHIIPGHTMEADS